MCYRIALWSFVGSVCALAAVGFTVPACAATVSPAPEIASGSGEAGVTARKITIQSLDNRAFQATIYSANGNPAGPALIAVHGGGWRMGSSAYYKDWGAFPLVYFGCD